MAGVVIVTLNSTLGNIHLNIDKNTNLFTNSVNALVADRTLRPRYKTAGKCIVIIIDNLASSFSIMTKDPILASCARELWLEAANADHEIQIEHRQGSEIPLADALSRSFTDVSKAKLASS